MSHYCVYLVGQIGDAIESYDWRIRVVEYFKNNQFVQVINPCDSEFDKRAFQGKKTADMMKRVHKKKHIGLLVPNDRGHVLASNVLFINMNIYVPDQPMIGSFFEMSWASDCPEKMLIGIFAGDPKEDYQCRSPFIKRSIHTWVKNDVEACELLEKFMVVRQ